MSDNKGTQHSENEEELRNREVVCKDAADVLGRLLELKQRYQLPEPPIPLDTYRRQLAEGVYQVLVVGEAKRGKSTFVNALVGSDLLPTDVDIATSQVFYVKQAEHEAYRLRFEGGSTQEIARDDLPRYGSQVMADKVGLPNLHTIIRWIEVDYPTRSLPPGIRILDTPGLGSLYEAHTQITQRFVQSADAVIFVLDSGQPITLREREFIREILKVTQNIFFIQTKTDQYSLQDWQKQQRANEEKIQQAFPEQMANAHIWPISSSNLMRAYKSGTDRVNDRLLRASHYLDLALALQTFLFRVAGWKRAAEAMQIAEAYHIDIQKILHARILSLKDVSVERRGEIQQRIQQRKIQFDEDWGDHGTKRNELNRYIHQIIRTAKRNFLASLGKYGSIASEEQIKINAIKSINEAEKYNEKMSEYVSIGVQNRLQQAQQQIESRSGQWLARFFGDASMLSVVQELDPELITVKHTHDLRLKSNWLSLLDANNSGNNAQAVWDFAHSMLPQVPLSSFVVMGVYWVLVVGIKFSIGKGARLEDAKKQLQENLEGLLATIRSQMLDDDPELDEDSYIDEFFYSREQYLSEYIERLVLQKSRESQMELDQLNERTQNLEQLQTQLTEWNNIAPSIARVARILKQLEQFSWSGLIE